MADFRHRVRRRALLSGLSTAALGRVAMAFGQDGAFNPRWLAPAGAEPLGGDRESALSRWSWELVRRTSAPGRLIIKPVAPDDPKLLSEPFVVWAGSGEVNALMRTEVEGLRRFFDLGGLVFVDDSQPQIGEFGRSVRRELTRVLPEVPVGPQTTTCCLSPTICSMNPRGACLASSRWKPCDGVRLCRRCFQIKISWERLPVEERTGHCQWKRCILWPVNSPCGLL